MIPIHSSTNSFPLAILWNQAGALPVYGFQDNNGQVEKYIRIGNVFFHSEEGMKDKHEVQDMENKVDKKRFKNCIGLTIFAAVCLIALSILITYVLCGNPVF